METSKKCFWFFAIMAAVFALIAVFCQWPLALYNGFMAEVLLVAAWAMRRIDQQAG